MRQSLRHLPRNGAAQHRVVQRLARHVSGSAGCLVGSLRRLQAGLRIDECGGRDKALVYQGFVVVQLALVDVYLRLGSIGLLLGLAQACLGFGGVNARHHLASAHAVALAQREALNLSRHPRLDHGRIHCAQRARDGNAQLQSALLHRDHLACGQLQRRLLP